MGKALRVVSASTVVLVLSLLFGFDLETTSFYLSSSEGLDRETSEAAHSGQWCETDRKQSVEGDMSDAEGFFCSVDVGNYVALLLQGRQLGCQYPIPKG